MASYYSSTPAGAADSKPQGNKYSNSHELELLLQHKVELLSHAYDLINRSILVFSPEKPEVSQHDGEDIFHSDLS